MSARKVDSRMVIKDAQRELASPLRRVFAKQILTLGGLTLLTGCTVTDDKAVNVMLRKISAFNDSAQSWLFDPKKLAPTYPESMITRPFPFNAFYDIDQVPDVDASTYRLQVGGLVKGKHVWTLDELHALPQTSQVTRHICMEGWSAIGEAGRHAVRVVPAAGRRRHHGQVCVVSMRRRLFDEHRHAHGAPSSDTADAHVRRTGAAGEVRLSDEAADSDQARLQESKAHSGHDRDEHLSRRLLGKSGL